MPTVFESTTDGFYTAFFEPDLEKRRGAIEAWIKKSTQVIQSAVENDLRAYLEEILEATWTEEGWKKRAKKFYDPSFIDKYKLYLDIKIRRRAPRDKEIRRAPRDKEIINGPLTPEVRAKTNDAIEAAKLAIAKIEPPSPISLREIDLHNDYKVEVAIPMLEKFLEESYRDNVRRVRIIHGKGIFVLQKAAREYLGNHKFVISNSISSADRDHGGEGATEANLIGFNSDLL